MLIHNLFFKNKIKYIYSRVQKTNNPKQSKQMKNKQQKNPHRHPPVTSDLFSGQVHWLPLVRYIKVTITREQGPFSPCWQRDQKSTTICRAFIAHATSPSIISTSFIWSEFAGQKVLTDYYRQCMTWATSLQHRGKGSKGLFCLGFLIALKSYIEDFKGPWEFRKG